ncbi:MAG: hypothetical protein IPN73_17355 [Saprospiraceae bacterium]|nr:hypothetical protein [Saprospiraceae bacterium]
MKKILALVLSCLPPFLFSQQPFPLEFKGYGTMWQRLITNGDGSFPGQTGSIYTSVEPIDLVDVDSVLYILYRTKRNSLIDGIILEKINLSTGQLIWQTIDNSYTGNESFQKYQSLYLNKEDNLDVIGLKAKDNTKAFAPNMCKKKFYSSNGVNYFFNTDTTDFKYSLTGGSEIFPIGQDSIYLTGTPWGESVEQNPRIGIKFYSLSKKLVLDTSAQVIFNEPSDLDSFTYSHVVLNPRFQIINNQLLGIICIYLNEKEGKYSTRAELIIVDYSNLKNLQVVRRINFGSEIYDWPNEEFYYRLYSYNEEIQLTWRYPKKDTINDKIFRACSFLSLDTLGNVLARVDDIAQNDHWIYNLKCTGKLNEKYYLIGHRSDDRASFDILEIDSVSQVKLLVSVVTADRPSNDGFNGLNTLQNFRSDSTLIFSGALFTKGGDVVPSTTSTLYTMAFDLRQWMRPTASEEVVKDMTIKLYPNPSYEYLNIEVPNIKGKLHFYSSIGALLKTISINGSQSLLVDTSVFPVGVNVITIEPAEKTGVVRSVTFTKM